MDKKIIDVLDEHVTVKIDKRLLRKLTTYNTSFTQKNEEHIQFFGSPLLGVNSVKFTQNDADALMEDVLGILDVNGLQEDINTLPFFWYDDNGKPSTERRVLTNLSYQGINLVLLYIAHKALHSKHLNSKERTMLSLAAINILQYKFFSSMHHHYFKHPSNINVALAVYEALDNKSSIKKYGTWKALLDNRSIAVLDNHGALYKDIYNFNDDIQITKVLNAIQGRLKSILNKLTDMFYEMRRSDSKIVSMGRFIELDDGAVLRDVILDQDKYKNNITRVIPSVNDFIKTDVLAVVGDVVKAVNVDRLHTTLVYLSNNYNGDKQKDLHTLINSIMVFLFDLVRTENLSLNNIPLLMIKVRSSVKSSRTLDSNLKQAKELSGYLISDALSTNSKGTISSIRVGLIIYIILRSLLK